VSNPAIEEPALDVRGCIGRYCPSNPIGAATVPAIG
jgi:hypothetical protein